MRFDQFVKIFPEVQLPVSITEDSATEYSTDNDPFSERMIADFILPGEAEVDEFTEFIPGFRIAGLKDIIALVYWKAGLMNYQYILATYEMGGKSLDRQVIAGTFSDGNTIVRSVARIDTDLTIYIASGMVEGSDDAYDAGETTTRELELLPDGRVVELA